MGQLTLLISYGEHRLTNNHVSDALLQLEMGFLEMHDCA